MYIINKHMYTIIYINIQKDYYSLYENVKTNKIKCIDLNKKLINLWNSFNKNNVKNNKLIIMMNLIVIIFIYCQYFQMKMD
jgi:hypothetical protein